MGSVGKRARRYNGCVMPDAVIFDLYETLITEFDPDWQPRPSTAERLGVDQEAFDAAWREADPRRTVGAYADLPTVLRDLCETIGERADEAIVQQLYAELVEEKARVVVGVAQDVIEMLRGLRDAGMKLGLISNCAQEEVAAWDRSPLAQVIEAPIFSCDVGWGKPDVEIYRLACERLAILPRRGAYVGDGGDDELSGAAAAGLTPYWASWFIDRWPAWRRNQPVYQRAASYPRLRTVGEAAGVG